jgi:hypothetical protein
MHPIQGKLGVYYFFQKSLPQALHDSGSVAILIRRYETWQPAWVSKQASAVSFGMRKLNPQGFGKHPILSSKKYEPGHGVIFESNLLKKANALPKG